MTSGGAPFREPVALRWPIWEVLWKRVMRLVKRLISAKARPMASSASPVEGWKTIMFMKVPMPNWLLETLYRVRSNLTASVGSGIPTVATPKLSTPVRDRKALRLICCAISGRGWFIMCVSLDRVSSARKAVREFSRFGQSSQLSQFMKKWNSSKDRINMITGKTG